MIWARSCLNIVVQKLQLRAYNEEWVDRTRNAAHDVWVTDKRRKSKRERIEIKRLLQSSTGMQTDRYESGASGTDEDDVRSPDFQ